MGNAPGTLPCSAVPACLPALMMWQLLHERWAQSLCGRREGGAGTTRCTMPCQGVQPKPQLLAQPHA